MYASVYIYTYVYIYIYIHSYIHMCTCIYIYVYIRTYIHICIHSYKSFVCLSLSHNLINPNVFHSYFSHPNSHYHVCTRTYTRRQGGSDEIYEPNKSRRNMVEGAIPDSFFWLATLRCRVRHFRGLSQPLRRRLWAFCLLPRWSFRL